MADFDSSLYEQLKSFVINEYKNYIPVPSLAESSEFGILYFCSPKSVDQSTNQSWYRKTFSWPSFSRAASDSGSSPNLISLGWLFDHIPDNSDEVKAKEEPVCIHGQASGSQKSGGMQIEMLPGQDAKPIGCGGSALFEKNNNLDMGKIVKYSVPYNQVSYWLKSVTMQNCPELFKEAKKSHLYVIYEILTAEHLKINAQDNNNIEGHMSGMVQNCVGVKGAGTWKRNKDCRLSRPKSMGRYTFAYKCGRVIAKKNVRHLKLVGLKNFHEPFQIREPLTDQSQPSSQEEDISNDEFITIKTGDDKD